MTTALEFPIPQGAASESGDQNAAPQKSATDDERERRRIARRIKELDDEYESMKTHNAYLRWKATKNGNILQDKKNSVKTENYQIYDHVYCNNCCFFFAASEYNAHKELHIAVDRMIQIQNSENENDNSFPELSRRANNQRMLRPRSKRWERRSPY